MDFTESEVLGEEWMQENSALDDVREEKKPQGLTKDIILLVLKSAFLEVSDGCKLCFLSKQLSFGAHAALGVLANSMAKPLSTRFKMWEKSLITSSVEIDLERVHRGDRQKFYELNAGPNLNMDKSYVGQTGEIMRDVRRTFPAEPYFQQVCAPMMARVLTTIASARPDVGYCQGMNFVTGLLVLCRISQDYATGAVFLDGGLYQAIGSSSARMVRPLLPCITPDSDFIEFPEDEKMIMECDVFWVVMALLAPSSKLCMGGHWSPGVPKMRLRSYQFDRVLLYTLPKLHQHLDDIQLSAEVLASQWFIPLFAYTLPLYLTLHIWDYIFVGGWSAAFRVVMALLSAAHDDLLNTTIESMSAKMRCLDWQIFLDAKVNPFISNMNDDGRTVLVLAHAVNAMTEDLITLPTNAVTDEVLEKMNEDYATEIIEWAQATGDTLHKNRKESVFGKLLSLGRRNADNKPIPKALSGHRSTNRETETVTTVGWPQRYGQEVTEEEFQAIRAVVSELDQMVIQLREDKNKLQMRITAASAACKEAREALKDARGRVEKQSQHSSSTIAAITDSFERLGVYMKRTNRQVSQTVSALGLGERPSGGVSIVKGGSQSQSSIHTDTAPITADGRDDVLVCLERCEEADQFKEVLCKQLQIVVENAHLLRSRKLTDLANTFG
jgi:hypothetical protein